ncbi:hypothetical protein D3C86_2254360 [compost metagenome]
MGLRDGGDVRHQQRDLFAVGLRKVRIGAALVVARKLAIGTDLAGEKTARQRRIAEDRDAMLATERQ